MTHKCSWDGCKNESVGGMLIDDDPRTFSKYLYYCREHEYKNAALFGATRVLGEALPAGYSFRIFEIHTLHCELYGCDEPAVAYAQMNDKKTGDLLAQVVFCEKHRELVEQQIKQTAKVSDQHWTQEIKEL